MKGLLILLLVVLVFFGCAIVGYNLAGNRNPVAQATVVVDPSQIISGEQHRFIIMRADALDTAQPRLVSIWYVSVYFLENYPTTLTLAQVYPVKTATPNAQALAQSFALNPQTGEPADAFWQALQAYGLQWEAYVLTDIEGANAFLNWWSGPADYRPALTSADGNADTSVQLATQTCMAVANAATHQIGTFDWGTVVPLHFRSSLRMENGLAYWDRVTGGASVRCEIVSAP